MTVSTEVEALQLEYSWIKEFDPRFNVRYRDDKSYPFLAVTLDEEYPRLMVMRGAKRKGVRYFGPYSHAWAIRETLDLLLRVFPARTCSAGVFKRHRPDRPAVPARRHRQVLGTVRAAGWTRRSTGASSRTSASSWPAGPTGWSGTSSGRCGPPPTRWSSSGPPGCATTWPRCAGRWRSRPSCCADGTDADVVAFAEDQLEAAVQVFHVRGGRVRGQRGWVVEKTEELSTGDLVHHFCTQVYGSVADAEGRGGDLPREVLVPALPADADALADWLSQLRGARVSLRIPQRGDKRTLMETVARNAGEALTQHKLRRAGDLTARSQALEEIAEGLGLDVAPLRIECYDVSQIQGTDVVASMVVFEDGLARKSEYRRFIVTGRDRRRLGHLRGAAPAVRPVPGRPRRRRAHRRRASPRSTPRRAGPASSRTPPTWSSSTAARRRSTRPGRCSPSWASPTSRWPAWPSGWRRSGSRGRRSR